MWLEAHSQNLNESDEYGGIGGALVLVSDEEAYNAYDATAGKAVLAKTSGSDEATAAHPPWRLVVPVAAAMAGLTVSALTYATLSTAGRAPVILVDTAGRALVYTMASGVTAAVGPSAGLATWAVGSVAARGAREVVRQSVEYTALSAAAAGGLAATVATLVLVRVGEAAVRVAQTAASGAVTWTAQSAPSAHAAEANDNPWRSPASPSSPAGPATKVSRRQMLWDAEVDATTS